LVTAGAKYRIDAILIKGTVAFPKEEIITQLPVSPGALFNATAIGNGLENIRKLYSSKSYMNFGARPMLQFDETRHTVVLTIDIDEGQPPGNGNHSHSI
jgi:outer membrane protein assembly factor BamA